MLRLLVVLCVLFSGCAIERGEPVGADYIDGVFYCRDAHGHRWESNGECD